MAKRCLIVSYYFPPLGGGGVQRITKFIKFASRLDWDFTVISAHESNNPLPQDQSLLQEIPPDTRIIRISSRIGRGGGLLSELLVRNRPTYFFRWLSALRYIPDSRKNWIPVLRQAILKELNEQNYDSLLFTCPPYSLAGLAAELTERLSLPVVLDMRDPWTSNPYKIYPTPYHKWRDRMIEREAISKIRFGISAYKSLIDFYKTHIPEFSRQRWITVPNGFDEEDFAGHELNSERRENSTFNLCFSGSFYSHINHPKFILRTIKTLKQAYPHLAARLRFHHAGNSVIDLNRIARKYGLTDQVKSWGYRSHQDLLKILNRMDAFCFILDDKYACSSNTIGAKVYEYLRFRRPILALVPQKGEAAELINETQSGVVCPASNNRQAAEILASWIKAVPEFNFKGIDRFRREYQAEKIAGFLDKISGKESGTA